MGPTSNNQSEKLSKYESCWQVKREKEKEASERAKQNICIKVGPTWPTRVP